MKTRLFTAFFLALVFPSLCLSTDAGQEQNVTQVRGLHVLQGQHAAVYAKTSELHVLRALPDGSFAKSKVSIQREGDVPVKFFRDPFPSFFMCNGSPGVPLTGYLWRFSKANEVQLNPEWLWWMDLRSLEARSLREWGVPFSRFSAFNAVDSVFPALWWKRYARRNSGFLGEPDRKDRVLVLMSIEDGTHKISEVSPCASSCGFVLKDGKTLLHQGYGGREQFYLLKGGQRVLYDVNRGLGATPDASRVFFTKPERIGNGTKESLWYYDTNDGSKGKLIDFVGHTFRVSQDSSRVGFLYANDRVGTHQSRWDPISGAKTFGLDGNLVREFKFDLPVEASVFDWDPEWEVIFSFHPRDGKIIVRRLNGEVLARIAP